LRWTAAPPGLGKLREGAKADEETTGKAREEGTCVRFRRRDGIEEGNRMGGESFCSFRLSAGFFVCWCCVNRQGIGNRNGLRVGPTDD